MKRRNFISQTSLAGAALLSSPAFAEGKKKETANGASFHLNYAFHDGMFKNSAGNDFIDQIQYAYDLGFRAIEDNGMMGRTPEMQSKIGEALAKLGMSMGVFVHGFDSWPVHTSLTSGNKEWVDKFIDYSKKAVETSKRCGGKLVTVVPGNYDHSKSTDMQTANVILALRKVTGIFEPHSIVMVLESLSDTPELFLRGSDQAYAICKAVNSPSCKMLHDMYHMQRNQGDIIHHMDDAWDEIAYLQIGDNPGRNEPTTGEMNYKNIFKHIYNKDYKGMLGMEHGNSLPGKEGEAALVKAYREVDNFI